MLSLSRLSLVRMLKCDDSVSANMCLYMFVSLELNGKEDLNNRNLSIIECFI